MHQVLLALLALSGPVQEAAPPHLDPVVPPAGSERQSVFGEALHLGEDPPEARSVAAIKLLYKGCTGAPRDMERDLESTIAFASSLRDRVLRGDSFADLARRHSASSTAPTGGVLGTFTRGDLYPDFEAFLFASDFGEVSEPLVQANGVHLLTRVERRAGARVLCAIDRGEKGRSQLAAWKARIEAGEDFFAVAREVSEDPVTAPRGGALAVFERARGDMLVKAAAFELRVGQFSQPIDTPRGLYLVQRVEPEQIPLELHENPWMDLRCILVTFDGVRPPLQAQPRTYAESEQIAAELAERIRAGADMGELAAEFDDDNGGRERAGRVGWVHQQQPGLANYIKALWREAPGVVQGPVALPIGHLIYRRDR